MVAGIGAGDHRNGGVRRVTVVARYRAVHGEAEGSFEPRTRPGARGGVVEGVGGPTELARMENTAAGAGDEVAGELDFRHPMSIPSARTVLRTRRRRGSAHHTGLSSRTAASRHGIWLRFCIIFLLPNCCLGVAVFCKYKKQRG